MDCHTLTLIYIIIFSGLFGGIANFFMSYDKDTVGWFVFFKSLVLGLSAAIIVPLFLTTIHSNLLDPPGKGSSNNDATVYYSNYFVFTGFCILAAILSKRFIEDVYNRVVKAEKDAKEAKKDAKAALDVANDLETSATEPDIDKLTSEVKAVVDKNLSEKEKKIIKAINDSRYTYRTLTGIAKEVGLPEGEVLSLLEILEVNKIVLSKHNKKRNKIWRVLE